MPNRFDEDYNNAKELKKEHSFISIKKKQKLIALVVSDGLTIYRAAKRLKICHPTAKFIMKNYRNTEETTKRTKSQAQTPKGASQHTLLICPQENQKQNEGTSFAIEPNDQPSFTTLGSFEQPMFFPNIWFFESMPCLFQPYVSNFQ